MAHKIITLFGNNALCYKKAAQCAGLLLSIGGLSACTKVWSDVGNETIGTNRPIVTTASFRTVIRSDGLLDSETHRVNPEYITCAEPSPDVATALSGGFGLGGTISGEQATPAAATGASPAELQLAGSIAASRAESVAQLGERLATVQLLRDALYRACEAYANGAVTGTTYTLIVSKLDRLMVTLLTSEIAGGAFGRKFSGLGGSADGAATANLAKGQADAMQAKLTEIEKTQQTIQADEKALSDTQAQLDAAVQSGDTTQQAALTKTKEDQTATLNKDKGVLTEQQKALNDMAGDLAVAMNTSAQTHATATFAAGGDLGDKRPDAAIAGVIEQMQENYITDTAPSAAIAACITELSQTSVSAPQRASLLSALCEKNFTQYFNFVHTVLSVKLFQICQTLPTAERAPCFNDARRIFAELSQSTDTDNHPIKLIR